MWPRGRVPGLGSGSAFGRYLFVVGTADRIMADLPTPLTCEEPSTPHNQEKKSSCGVCLEAHRESKVLPCCHTFCKSCLDGLVTESDPQLSTGSPRASTSKNDILRCPECRTEHDIPDGGIAAFLTDISLENSNFVASRDNESAPVAKRVRRACGECEGGEPAIAYCHDCEAFVCESCKVALHKAKRYRDHSIKYLSEVDDPNSIPTNTLSSLTCPVHPPEKQQAYCKTCQCLVCVRCIVKSHQKHDLGELDTVRKDIEKKLTQACKQGEEQMVNFEQYLKHLKSVEALVSARVEKLQAAINKAIDANIALLEQRRKALFEEVKEKHDTDMKKVWSQKDQVERIILGLKSALKFSGRVRQCSSNPEALGLASQACSRMNELKTQKWAPDEMTRIKQNGLEFSHPMLSNHFTKFGFVKPTYQPKVFIDIPPEVELGKPVTITIAERDTHDLEVWSTNLSMELTISYGKSKKSITLDSHPTSDGKREATFTPTCGGQHVITANPATGSFRSLRPYGTATFTVTGMPPVGSRVVRGPDYYDNDEDNPLIVKKHYVPPRKGKNGKELSLFVSFDNGKSYGVEWGDHDRYVVELAGCSNDPCSQLVN